jgi:hypothetical protein
MKYLYVGSINRSGGSLLCRMLDGHPDVASYPIEIAFPINKSFYPFTEALGGVPTHIPKYSPLANKNPLDFLEITKEKQAPVHKWGKERGDVVGVRKNYLEKVFYGSVKTDFDYSKYIDEIVENSKDAKCAKDIYDIRNRAYFNAWDNGAHAGTMKYVTFNASNGLFLSNEDSFFNEFPGSLFIHPIRDVTGYIASEKTRITRRFYGSRRFLKVKMPNFMVKYYNNYDFNVLIRCWRVAITRAVLLQEKYGVEGGFFVYRYENLVRNPQECIRSVCNKSGLEYNDNLLLPTIMGEPWKGNSHQGKQKGINPNLTSYFEEVLSEDELSIINEKCGPTLEYLHNCKTTPVDLTKIPKDILFDYDYQKEYFEDEGKLAIYTAFAFSGMRKVLVKPPEISAVLAYIYGKIIRIIHLPRMIKLKLFPGLGKQNYT